MRRTVWGIDVSKYSVKAVRLESVRDAIHLTALDVIQYADAGTGESTQLDDHIRETLADLKKNNRIGSEPVVISLPGHSTFNRLIKLPPVDDSKIAEVVRYEAQSQIPFPIEEVIWDFQLIDRPYTPGEEKEVILFAIKRDIVEQFLENIKPIGLNIDAVQFGPIALYNFLNFDQDLGNTACIALDVGSDNTDLIVLDGPKFWVRNLPITGNNITRSLMKAFNVSFSEAEQLKLKAGQSQQAQKIFTAVQSDLRDLVGEVHRSVGYYKSISRQAKFEKILLLGNATKTLNFQKFISQSLQLPAARPQKLNHISLGSIDQGLLNNALPSLGTALGLALQGLEQTANKINLLPPAFLAKKKLRKKQPAYIAAAVILYGLVGLMYTQASSEQEALSTVRQELETAVGTYDANKIAFEEASKLEEFENKLLPFLSIPSDREGIFELFRAINERVTDNVRRDLPDEEKVWIVQWKVREEDAEPPKAGNTTNLLPKKRRMRVEVKVMITKRGSVNDEADFVRSKLLNWDANSKTTVDPSQGPSIVEKYPLEFVEPDTTPVSTLVATAAGRDTGNSGTNYGFTGTPTTAEARFTPVTIGFYLPLTASLQEPKKEAKPEGGDGTEDPSSGSGE